jgi:hypothetical protein
MPGELLRNLTPPFILSLGKGKPRHTSRTLFTPTPASPTITMQQQSQLFLIAQNDEIYEQDVLRNPGTVRPWLDYANYKRQYGTLLEQSFVLERACTALPRSYKLWKLYLERRVAHLKGKNPSRNKGEFQKVNALFERALVLLNKMPVIWEMYDGPSIAHFERCLLHSITESGCCTDRLRNQQVVRLLSISGAAMYKFTRSMSKSSSSCWCKSVSTQRLYNGTWTS